MLSISISIRTSYLVEFLHNFSGTERLMARITLNIASEITSCIRDYKFLDLDLTIMLVLYHPLDIASKITSFLILISSLHWEGRITLVKVVHDSTPDNARKVRPIFYFFLLIVQCCISVAFINKLDRMGADPFKVLNQARKKLRHHSAAVQILIGLEEDFQGLVDLNLLYMTINVLVLYKDTNFYIFCSETVVTEEVPADMQAMTAEKRRELIEAVSDVDDQLAEAFLSDEPISSADLEAAIRRATIARKFIPVFMGSAFKNMGVQPLLDGVHCYLPNPLEVDNFALDHVNKEEKLDLWLRWLLNWKNDNLVN